VKIALTFIQGIGRNNVFSVLKEAKVDADLETEKLNDQQVARLQKAIDSLPTEGVLKKSVVDNINRLKQIGSYKGKRHVSGLPVRGQRTRTNARTKRGKRMTIGAMKKKMLQKIEKGKKGKSKDLKKKE